MTSPDEPAHVVEGAAEPTESSTAASEKLEEKPKRAPGRPARRDAPSMPWDDIERLYIQGEQIRQRDDGSFERIFPSLRELGEKYGVSKSLIGYRAERYDWSRRRAEFQGQVQKETEAVCAKARAVEITDAVGVLDDYIERFRTALKDGRIRTDSVQDLNVAVRLKHFLLGGADSRKEVNVLVSLEVMQERHRKLREQVAAMDAELAGVVGDADESMAEGPAALPAPEKVDGEGAQDTDDSKPEGES